MKVLHLTTHINSGGITQYISQIAKPLSEVGIESYVLSSGGNQRDAFRTLGIEHHTTPIKTKSILHPKLYFAIPHVIKIIKENKIDLLHAHSRVTQVLAYWIQKQIKIPVVTTCHGYFKNRLGRRLLPAWGDYAIAISEPVGERLRNVFNVPGERVCVVPNGIDYENLVHRKSQHDSALIRKTRGISTESKVLGIISRLVGDKGHSDLIQAFIKLCKRRNDLHLVIVGDGKEKNILENFARQSECSDKILFWGRSDDIAEPLSIFDLFVFPPTFREGFGLNLAEAMACRLPVITTKIWALESIFEHKKTAYMVNPSNPEMLANAIDEVLTDRELSARLKQKGFELVSSKYSLAGMAKGIAQVYQKACPNAA